MRVTTRKLKQIMENIVSEVFLGETFIGANFKFTVTVTAPTEIANGEYESKVFVKTELGTHHVEQHCLVAKAASPMRAIGQALLLADSALDFRRHYTSLTFEKTGAHYDPDLHGCVPEAMLKMQVSARENMKHVADYAHELDKSVKLP